MSWPPAVDLAPGCHKFVHVVVQLPQGETVEFVRSKDYAEYHYMAATELKAQLKELGVHKAQIQIPGGGRCIFDPEQSYVKVYGYSNQFGEADLERVARLVQQHLQPLEGSPPLKVEFAYEGY